ncbi:hypothetical protein ABT311_13000, partial [Saccharopolyspora hirsuta]
GERSDSSGLLDVGDEPWSGVGTPPAVGDPDAPAGALPGGPAPEPPGSETPLAATSMSGNLPPGAAGGEEQLDDTVLPVASAPLAAGGAPLPPSPAPAPQPGPGERSKERAVTVPGEAEPPAAQQVPAFAAKPTGTEIPLGTGAVLEADAPFEADAPLVRDAPQQEVDDGEPGGPEGDTVDQEAPERQEDHVAIVQPVGDKDTSSWDVPVGALPWLVPFAVRPAAEDEGDRAKPDHALRDSAPWQDTTFATWRRATLGEDEQPPVRDQPPMCGGPDYTPEQLAEMRAAKEAEAARAAAADDEDDEEDGAERSSADLLVRDDSAWGGGRAVPPSGGIG